MITRWYKNYLKLVYGYDRTTTGVVSVPNNTDIYGDNFTIYNYVSITGATYTNGIFTQSNVSKTIYYNSTETNVAKCLMPTKFFKALPIDLSTTTRAGYDASCGAIVLGTGTTPPTENDYYLESPITSGLSVTGLSFSAVYDENDNITGGKVTYTIQNDTNSNITFSEVGLLFTVPTSQFSTSVSNLYFFLMDRTVLPNAVTIPAGETVNVSVKFTQ